VRAGGIVVVIRRGIRLKNDLCARGVGEIPEREWRRGRPAVRQRVRPIIPIRRGAAGKPDEIDRAARAPQRFAAAGASLDVVPIRDVIDAVKIGGDGAHDRVVIDGESDISGRNNTARCDRVNGEKPQVFFHGFFRVWRETTGARVRTRRSL